MSRPNTVAERLRAFVRARAKKDGAHYRWGNASRLAEFLQVDNGWVTEYTDQPPSSHADIDTALQICRFYRVKITDFESDVEPSVQAPANPPLTRIEARVLRLLRLMNEEGQQLAAQSIAGFARAFPQRRLRKLVEQSSETSSATTNRGRGKR